MKNHLAQENLYTSENLLDRLATKPKKHEVISCGDLKLNNVTKTVEINGEAVPFRIKEFELLWYFMTHEDEAISKTSLIEEVWGYEFYEDVNSLNVRSSY